MKQKIFYTLLGAASMFVLAFMVAQVGAQSSGQGTNPLQTSTPMPGPQSTPVAPGWGMGMHGGMMANAGMMRGGMMANAGMTHSGMMSEFATAANHDNPAMGSGVGMNDGMMGGGDPMHESAQLLGMTDQDLYNQMMNGKSVVQVAAENGVTEQQLMDSMMATHRAAYDQAVQQGQMTRLYADTMLMMINNNLKMMINIPGYGTGGMQ